MSTAMDVANYFLAVHDKKEFGITNIRIQLLCVYAQAFSVSLLDRPLFEEDIQAWESGPVIPSLYKDFQRCTNVISVGTFLSEKDARLPFDDEQKLILELAQAHYGHRSELYLCEKSRQDFPGQFGSKEVIPQYAIKVAFSGNSLVQKFKLGIRNDACQITPPEIQPEGNTDGLGD